MVKRTALWSEGWGFNPYMWHFWYWDWPKVIEGMRVRILAGILYLLINSMYKWHFDKPNRELLKTHLAAISRICKLHIQISNIHMCVVPGPASQDAVIKRVYASPGLQCINCYHFPPRLFLLIYSFKTCLLLWDASLGLLHFHEADT